MSTCTLNVYGTLYILLCMLLNGTGCRILLKLCECKKSFRKEKHESNTQRFEKFQFGKLVRRIKSFQICIHIQTIGAHVYDNTRKNIHLPCKAPAFAYDMKNIFFVPFFLSLFLTMESKELIFLLVLYVHVHVSVHIHIQQSSSSIQCSGELKHKFSSRSMENGMGKFKYRIYNVPVVLPSHGLLSEI